MRTTKIIASAMAGTLMLGAQFGSAEAAEHVSRSFCESNLVAAQRSADMAAASTKDFHSVVWGGVGTAGCALASAALGFTDLGILSLGCGLISAKLSTFTVPDAAGQAAQDAFDRVRDPRRRK